MCLLPPGRSHLIRLILSLSSWRIQKKQRKEVNGKRHMEGGAGRIWEEPLAKENNCGKESVRAEKKYGSFKQIWVGIVSPLKGCI